MADVGARLGRLRYAAALASGPTEVMDFLLPLWAAADLGATPAAIGLVVAIEAGASLAVRPVAGVLADRADRQLVAAIGAALYATAFVVYAVAPGIVVVGLGAAVGGAGGALFWVALRADVGARLEQDPAVYARLLSSEQAGSLAAFVIGLSLLGSIGYRPLFLVGAAACLVAMALLLGGRGTARPQRRDGVDGRTGLRHVGGRLAPLLAVTALTAGAESGLALVLLLHLQAAFELEPQQIALLFLPGAIVLVVLPERAYELAIRLGRARSMMFSLVAGALFTASLALFDTPFVVAALWMLCAAAIATALPVEQATVAQASAGSLGRGVGLYETAALLGAVIASPVIAAVYGGPGWRIACAIAATGFILGAALVPLVVRMLGLSDSWHRRPMPDPARAMLERLTLTAATAGHPAAPKTPDLRQGGQDRSSALSLPSRSRRVRTGFGPGHRRALDPPPRLLVDRRFRDTRRRTTRRSGTLRRRPLGSMVLHALRRREERVVLQRAITAWRRRKRGGARRARAAG